MPGIIDVATAIRSIGAAATVTAQEVAAAEQDIRRAQQSGASASAGMSGGSSANGGVGASVSYGTNTNVTSRGMSKAISQARRSL